MCQITQEICLVVVQCMLSVRSQHSESTCVSRLVCGRRKAGCVESLLTLGACELTLHAAFQEKRILRDNGDCVGV